MAASPAASEGASAAAVARGVIAGLLVAFAGEFANLRVGILAVVSLVCFLDLARRENAEWNSDAPDWTGWMMQVTFLLILCAGAWDNRGAALVPPFPGAVELTGFALIVAGLILRQQTASALGRHFTVRVQTSDDHELVQTGPFRILRHPSYASLLLIALGTAVSVESPLAVVATLVLWLPAALLRIAHEEGVLARRFGDAYQSYARRTWRLVPGVY